MSPGGARSRDLDPRTQAPARRPSGAYDVHRHFGYRARRRRQSKALEETIDGPGIDGAVVLVMAIGAAPARRIRQRVDIQALIG